jgi:MFS family permease
VLFLVALPMSCVHQFYFARTSGFLSELKLGSGGVEKAIETVFGAGGGGLMTIGQLAELAVLAFMPWLLKRFTRKSLLMMGVLAYILRFAVFAYAPHPALVIPALALHGFCFGLFVFVCFLVVDENTSSDVRASAQGLFNLILIGIGIIAGNLVAGAVGSGATPGRGAEAVVDWRRLFSVPMWAGVGCLVILRAFYPQFARGERPETAS